MLDVHTHLGACEHMNASVDDLLLSMDNAGIEKALVFAGELNGVSNADMLRAIKPHADRLRGVIQAPLKMMKAAETVPDTSPNSPEAQRRREFAVDVALDKVIDQYGDVMNRWLGTYLTNPLTVGVKFYLGYEHFYPYDPLVYDFVRVAEEFGRTAIFHTGDCYSKICSAKVRYAHPLAIDDVATDFPQCKMVLAHMGWPWHLDAAQVCYKNKNVFADVSGFVYGDFAATDVGDFRTVAQLFQKQAGRRALLFGTDFPISNQLSYAHVANCVGIDYANPVEAFPKLDGWA